MTGRSVDQDGIDSPHPAAFLVLYDAFRALDCTTALDPADADDCASVADEAVRALTTAGLLVADTGSQVPYPERDARSCDLAGSLPARVCYCTGRLGCPNVSQPQTVTETNADSVVRDA